MTAAARVFVTSLWLGFSVLVCAVLTGCIQQPGSPRTTTPNPVDRPTAAEEPVGQGLPRGRTPEDAVYLESSTQVDGIRLHVQLQGRDDSPELIVVLHNGSAGPITVDRNLVIGLAITLIEQDGFDIWLDDVGDGGAEVLSAEEVRGRLVVVAPGESLQRRINLRLGFKVFPCGPAGIAAISLVAHEMGGGTRPCRGETVVALNDNFHLGDISSIAVTYSCDDECQRAIANCADVEVQHLDIYRGPLSVWFRVTVCR